MTAPTHVVSGLAAVVVVGQLTGISPDGVNLLAVIAGTLAPDIDGNGSITRPGTILRRLIGRPLAELLDMIFELISALIRLCFRHRGFIHSPLIVLCLVGLGAWLGQNWLFWFGGGYAMHLLGDAMTAGGIPIWSPFSTERVSLSSMQTGSRSELAIAVVLLLVTCVGGWSLLPTAVKDTHRQIYYALANAASPTELE